MKELKIDRYGPSPRKDPCGILRELWSDQNLSFAYDIVIGNAKKHKHLKMQEVYYITKGSGKISIGKDEYNIKEGELIIIPKDTWHNLIKTDNELEVLVITHPEFDQEDMIFE